MDLYRLSSLTTEHGAFPSFDLESCGLKNEH